MDFTYASLEDSFDFAFTCKEKILISTKFVPLSKLIEHLDQVRSIEDLVIHAELYEHDTAYPVTEFLLNNTSLKSLEIEFDITNDDKLVKFLQLVANYLSTSKSIKKLILYDPQQLKLNHHMAEILASGINRSNLESLGLVNIEDSNMTLFDKLSTNTTIKQLFLRGDSGFGPLLGTSLGSNLRLLQISHMSICNEALLSIINLLRNSTKLERFELKKLTTATNFSEICDAIAANWSLKTLIIESHPVENTEDIKRVLSAVKRHPTIDELKIGQIKSEGWKLIADDLLENTNNHNKLRSLTLGSKYDDTLVDLSQMTHFAEKLATNTTLKHLSLKSIRIVNQRLEDSIIFKNALKSNTTLVSLDFNPKSFYMDANGIIELMQYNKTLTNLSVQGIYVPDLTSFYAAIMQNENLTSLDISRMTYEESEEKVVQFVLDVLVNNTTLKEFRCSKIPSKRKDFLALNIQNTLPSLKYNHTLTGLDVFNYPRMHHSESELKIIADVFSTNKTLVKFHSEGVENRDIEPYLRRNREYRVDAVILWYNIVRAEEQVLPSEIWRLILQQVSMFSLAMEVNLNKK